MQCYLYAVPHRNFQYCLVLVLSIYHAQNPRSLLTFLPTPFPSPSLLPQHVHQQINLVVRLGSDSMTTPVQKCTKRKRHKSYRFSDLLMRFICSKNLRNLCVRTEFTSLVRICFCLLVVGVRSLFWYYIFNTYIIIRTHMLNYIHMYAFLHKYIIYTYTHLY